MKIARQRYPFLLAAGAGLVYAFLARAFFKNTVLPSSGLLSAAFLLVMPVALGALTAYCVPEAPSKLYAGNSWWRLVWATFLVVLTFLCAASLFHLEGLICVLIICPAFLIGATLGAHAYAGFADDLPNKSDKTLVVVAFTLLPFIAGPIESRFSNPFNWYAGLWTGFVMSEIQSRILTVLKRRCEAPRPVATQ